MVMLSLSAWLAGCDVQAGWMRAGLRRSRARAFPLQVDGWGSDGVLVDSHPTAEPRMAAKSVLKRSAGFILLKRKNPALSLSLSLGAFAYLLLAGAPPKSHLLSKARLACSAIRNDGERKSDVPAANRRSCLLATTRVLLHISR